MTPNGPVDDKLALGSVFLKQNECIFLISVYVKVNSPISNKFVVNSYVIPMREAGRASQAGPK